ncbi:MAG: MBL fold metallo-hydrolase [Ruminococcaceae bacterium]|nr:MBL fold metallo-hydrolase [Oscillospiraceae bacterium]
MTQFSVYTLASGSKGNSVYVRLGEDELLIDAGTSCKRISDSLKALDTDISRIKAIFITHEHSDHVNALEVISKKYSIPVHFTEPSARAHLISKKTEFTAQAAVIHPPVYSVRVGALEVRSFITPHDSAGSVGYVVSDGTPCHTLALATDIGCVTDEISDALMGAENVILESNHDENMLLCGPYPYELKRRILSNRGHLSNEAAAALVSRLAASGTKRILLAHLSEENNLPELAYHSSLCYLQDTDVSLSVAAPSAPTKLV